MRYILSAILVIFLTGCVHTYSEKEVSAKYNLPQAFRNQSYINELNDNKTVSEYKDPFAEIKSMLPDDDFINVLDIASKENPDLLILISKVKQARYQVKSATGAMIPSVSGSLDYSYSDNNDGLNGNLNLSWEVDIYGKLDALRKFASQMVENYKEILDIYKQMRSIGLVDETQYIETTMDYLTAQNNLQKYTQEAEQNKNALYALINNKEINIATDLVYDTSFAPHIPQINNIPAQVILNRPDVRAAVYTLNSELYNHYNRKMSLLPSLSISGNIGKLLSSSNGVTDLVWQIASSLTAPLLNRQELYAQLKIQEETVYQAEQSLQKYINTAISDIENATYVMTSSNKSYNNTKDILENAKSSMDILKSRWESGIIDDLEYLMAQNDFLNTFISFYNAWYENISSSIILYKSFGGSFSAKNNNGGDNL